MSPDPGSEYTVKCALRKAVLESSHLESIRDAVLVTYGEASYFRDH